VDVTRVVFLLLAEQKQMLSTYKKGWALAATAYLTFSTTHFKLNFNVVKRLLFVIASPIKMYSLKNLIRI